MKTFNDIQEALIELNSMFIKDFTPVEPAELNLDTHCCSILYLGEDLIAVNKADDNRLQYYGGFEYVEKEYRLEVGNYVYYSADDDRIAGHLNIAGDN